MVTADRLTDKFNGKSTDTKPTEGIRNGSKFLEMDTKKLFMFDEENGTWLEQLDGTEELSGW